MEWDSDYHFPMSITIDQAGRIVIPKAIRDQLHLVSGSELEVEASGNEIRLRVAELEPRLIRKRGLLIHHGVQLSEIEVAEFVRQNRENRSTSITPSSGQ